MQIDLSKQDLPGTPAPETTATDALPLGWQLRKLAIDEGITVKGVTNEQAKAYVDSSLRHHRVRLAAAVIRPGLVRFTRTRLRPTDLWGKDRLLAMVPGDSFTVEAEHQPNLQSIKQLCSLYSERTAEEIKAEGGKPPKDEDKPPYLRRFIARGNVDGSITVRCYNREAMPPKWAMDKEHANLQEQITKAGKA